MKNMFSKKKGFGAGLAKLLPTLFGIVLLVSIQSSFSLAGGDFGNGGDVVYCKASAENDLNGIYSLDFVMNRLSFTSYAFKTKTPESEILKRLSETVPELGEKFQGCIAATEQIFKDADFSGDRTWEPSEFELIEIPRTALSQKFPPNCKPTLAVHRQEFPLRINYHYNFHALRDLFKIPMQASFLKFHECNWDFRKPFDESFKANIYRLTSYLHSGKFFAELHNEKIVQTLEAFGVSTRTIEVVEAEKLYIKTFNQEIDQMIDKVATKSEFIKYARGCTELETFRMSEKMSVDDAQRILKSIESKVFEDRGSLDLTILGIDLDFKKIDSPDSVGNIEREIHRHKESKWNESFGSIRRSLATCGQNIVDLRIDDYRLKIAELLQLCIDDSKTCTRDQDGKLAPDAYSDDLNRLSFSFPIAGSPAVTNIAENLKTLENRVLEEQVAAKKRVEKPTRMEPMREERNENRSKWKSGGR